MHSTKGNISLVCPELVSFWECLKSSVPQDLVLCNRTVRENLFYGCEEDRALFNETRGIWNQWLPNATMVSLFLRQRSTPSLTHPHDPSHSDQGRFFWGGLFSRDFNNSDSHLTWTRLVCYLESPFFWWKPMGGEVVPRGSRSPARRRPARRCGWRSARRTQRVPPVTARGKGGWGAGCRLGRGGGGGSSGGARGVGVGGSWGRGGWGWGWVEVGVEVGVGEDAHQLCPTFSG